MKDAKFIELLNLYVDHQISPADATWLENEIQQNPERRQIYRQYCQMQKACVLLAENFRTAAPAAVVAGGKVVEFNPRRRRLARVSYTLGTIAAAACVAFVVVNRRSAVTTELPGQKVAVSNAGATVLAASPARPAAPQAAMTQVAARPALQPAFAGLIRGNPNSDVMLTSSERASFDWMTHVQIDPVPEGQIWFQSRPTIQAQELTFRSRPSDQLRAESAAFRFQR